ncbi:MAG: hypothetical protein KGM43_10605 [Planctomycetota bacterium]|nr:hypothetical protein [Planctomycetota bacterium]
MIPCAHCEQSLCCEACGEPYVPPSQAHYEALSRIEVPLSCPECEQGLVCRWCKTPYDGNDESVTLD